MQPYIEMTRLFRGAVKKLHNNCKADVIKAIDVIKEDPLVGQLKKGDLAGVRVYKFRMVNQLTLLAYVYDDLSNTVTLYDVGPHENFYRDLK